MVIHNRRRFKSRMRPPHDAGDPRVPVSGCYCNTCEAERESQHWARIGEILGEQERGMCKCGRALDEDGQCIAGEQCAYMKAPR